MIKCLTQFNREINNLMDMILSKYCAKERYVYTKRKK
jgi:hypothetical protein